MTTYSAEWLQGNFLSYTVFPMRSGKRLDISFNILTPLLLGFLIYGVGKTHSIPSSIRNYLPDAFWAYAFISSILIIWEREINRIWITAVFLISIAFEWFQYENIIAGTGDIGDILTYFLAFTIALKFNTSFKNRIFIQSSKS